MFTMLWQCFPFYPYFLFLEKRIARDGIALTPIGLVARVGRRATCHAPADSPVAVDVSADAAAARGGLPVLAPETRVRLRVDEAC